MVTVYVRAIDSVERCQACAATKRHLRLRGVDFTEVVVDRDERARDALAALGYSTLPVVVVERGGRPPTHWSGYRPGLCDALASPPAPAGAWVEAVHDAVGGAE